MLCASRGNRLSEAMPKDVRDGIIASLTDSMAPTEVIRLLDRMLLAYAALEVSRASFKTA